MSRRGDLHNFRWPSRLLRNQRNPDSLNHGNPAGEPGGFFLEKNPKLLDGTICNTDCEPRQMGYPRNIAENNFATKELAAILSRLANPDQMARFLAFAHKEIQTDPVKLSARMTHFLKGDRIPTTSIALLLKKFETTSP
jgi:hypothetical protein